MRSAVYAAVAAVISLSGCANLTTVDRTTSLPFDGNAKGVAIHLDAKQRLVFAKEFGAVCAEPSPDALSTIASSISGGVSIPTQGAASLANALTESGGSIGLRTQSITLMRDTMYRICELYYGRALNGVQVAQLLGRSQDLTAAVLAIEQLTGAVAARQVVLSGNSAATAAASVASTEALLAAARENETQKNDALKKAEADLTTKETDALNAKKAFDDAKAADPPTDPTKLADLSDKSDQAEAARKAAEQEASVKRGSAEESKKSREAIEKAHSSAITQASATATTAGAFAPPVLATDRVQLTKDTVEPLAKAVVEIVGFVVNKDNTSDSCLAMLTDTSPIIAANRRAEEAQEKAKVEAEKAYAATAGVAKDAAAAIKAKAEAAAVKAKDEADTITTAYDKAIDFCTKSLDLKIKRMEAAARPSP